MNQLLNGIESPMSKLDVVQKKYSELLADMRRLDRDHVKSKKRADQLQKEKDQSRSELSKTISMKEKLEKLCRELTRENKKMKVGHTKRVVPRGARKREVLAYTVFLRVGREQKTGRLGKEESRVTQRKARRFSLGGARRDATKGKP